MNVVIMETLGISAEELAARKKPFEEKGVTFTDYPKTTDIQKLIEEAGGADAMILAMEKIDRRGLENVRFIDADAKLLNSIFAPDEADRIYINFCDPWPKSRDAKLRLTSPFFLRVYADVLKAGGEIHFKTDTTPLFDWSIEQLEAEGWQLSEVTHDLHANGPVGIMTDYEAKFYEQGMKINRLVATRTAGSRSLTRDGAVPRLRNASLTDARGYEESQEANRRNRV